MERSFEVQLGDAGPATAGDLYHAVAACLAARRSAPGVLTAAFRHLSRAADDAIEAGPRLRPSAPLALLLPWSRRRAGWERLTAALVERKLRLPALEYPLWAHLAMLSFALFVIVGPWAGGSPTPDTILILLALAGGLYAALRKWCVGLARAFPGRATTWGDLARQIAAANESRLEAELHPWTAVEIWDEVCRLLVAATGLPRLAITPETRLPEA